MWLPKGCGWTKDVDVNDVLLKRMEKLRLLLLGVIGVNFVVKWIDLWSIILYFFMLN
jgi:hypothetical protein